MRQGCAQHLQRTVAALAANYLFGLPFGGAHVVVAIINAHYYDMLRNGAVFVRFQGDFEIVILGLCIGELANWFPRTSNRRHRRNIRRA